METAVITEMEAAIMTESSNEMETTVITEMEAAIMTESSNKMETTIWQCLFGGILFLILSFFALRYFWKKNKHDGIELQRFRRFDDMHETELLNPPGSIPTNSFEYKKNDPETVDLQANANVNSISNENYCPEDTYLTVHVHSVPHQENFLAHVNVNEDLYSTVFNQYTVAEIHANENSAENEQHDRNVENPLIEENQYAIIEIHNENAAENAPETFEEIDLNEEVEAEAEEVLQAEEAQSNAVSEINTFMSSIWTCFQRWI
jgi:hypothetical protein